MLQQVKDGNAELAFVNMPVSDDELVIEPCFEIHDIFVCGAKHDIKRSYSWEEISQEPLILLEENSVSRRYLNKQFSSKNIELKPDVEMAAHDLLIRFASIHLGVSCVIEEFSKDRLEQGIIQKMPLDPPLPARNIGCAYMKTAPLSLAAQEFLKLIRQDKSSPSAL